MAMARGARRIGFAVVVALLVSGLLTAVAPAIPAGAARTAGLGRVTGPGRAATRFSHSRAGPMAGTLMTTLSGVGGGSGLGLRSGKIAGVIRGITGAPYGGVCVTAAGAAGSRTVISHGDGRYVIGGLRPGRYSLRLASCPGGGGQALLGYAWPGLPSLVTVVAGQVRTLPTARAWVNGAGSGPSRSMSAGAKTGSISGRVTGGGQPLRDVCAFATRSPFTSQGPEFRATTSKTGRYTITGVRPGRYVVQFRTGVRACPSHANWLPQWYPYVTAPYATERVAWVRVRAGRSTKRINARLKLGAEIAGTVRTRAGTPVRGICVGLYSQFTFSGAYAVSAGSGRHGHYGLHGLFPGKYQVEYQIGCGTRGNYAAQWWRDRPSPAHAGTIRVASRQIVTGIDARLAPGGAITGTVRARTARAAPLAGICVTATSYDYSYQAAARTAKNGTYRLTGMDTGRYLVQFDPSCSGFRSAPYLPAQRTVAVRDGHIRAGVDARLRPAAGVSGVVTNAAGRPADSVCVNIGDHNNDYAFTNAHGAYSISGIVPGRYPVEFETDCGSPGSLASQWWNGQPDSEAANLMTFAAGRVDRRVDVRLKPGGTLAGVLTSTSGRPVRGDCIGLAAPHDSDEAESFSGGGFTARNGHYRLPDLTPGEYQVSFDCEEGRYADEWFSSQPDSTTAEFLAINPGVTTRLSQRLSLGGTIAGTVTRGGRPAGDICIGVYNARNKMFVLPIYSSEPTSNGHGRYRVGQLAPGRYLVQFSDCDRGVDGTEWYRGTGRELTATPVTVRAGRTTKGINAVVGRGGTISGTATGPSGRPASGVCVDAYDAASDSYSFGWTSSNGHYILGALGSGRYAVTFNECVTPPRDLAAVTLTRPIRVVAPRHVRDVNVRLAASGTIAGSVTAAGGSADPRSAACVVAVPANPRGSFQLAFTGADGRFRLTGLGAGTYQVLFDDPLCDFYDFGVPDVASQWFNDQPGQATATRVTVAAGRTTELTNAHLHPLGAIAGTVTTGNRAAVGGECVAAVPYHAAADPFTDLLPPSDIAITQATGRYRLLDLPPGRYRVKFSSGCGDRRFATQWWDGAGSARSARVITVRAATVGGIDATLRR